MKKAITAALAALVFSVGSASSTPAFSSDDVTPQSGTVSLKVQPKPNPADCLIPDDGGTFYLGYLLTLHLGISALNPDLDKKTLFADLSKHVTKPSMINCQGLGKRSFLHEMVTESTVDKKIYNWAVDWAISKGIDLNLKTEYNNLTARESFLMRRFDFIPKRFTVKEFDAILAKLDPPESSHPLCSDVDGQTPTADVDCIVAENVQTSFKTATSQSLKDIIGISDIYEANRALSSTALYPGWKATITLTCSPDSLGCGDAYLPNPTWTNEFIRTVKRTFGFGIKCNNGINLISTSSIGPGESISITHSSDTERTKPAYQNCEAISGSPFTLHIVTTRKAK